MKNFFSIGIAGLGNVGSATVNLIKQNNSLITKNAGTPIKIVAVSARNKFAKRHFWSVNFYTGNTYGRFYPYQSLAVRLVRNR